MTTKGDIISGSLSPMHSKFASTEALSTKNSNAQYKRSPNVLSSLTSNKSNSFFNNPPAQDSNTLFSANQHHTTSSNTNSRKSPVKSLAIDTSEEASKYNNTQNTHFGSYSTTHNNTGSYNFSRGALASSFSGNLTTKFGSRGGDTYKPSLMPSGKSLSTSKLLLGSANGFPYQSSTQALKDSTAAVVNTMNENLGHTAPSPQTHYKNPSAKYYPVEANKSSSSVDSHHQFEAKSPSFAHSKNVYSSHQQENQQPGNENAPANSQNSTYNNESIANSSKTPSNNTASTKKLSTPIPNHEPTKCSVKRNGIVKAYAANTNQGIVRNYNEDRVSIILNIMKPASRANEDWPKCSFFGVYDGHGGVTCADFLRDNLHQFVIKEPSFPWNPKEALMKGFEAAEKQFLEIAENQPNGEIDRSGSCAIVVLIIGDMCYVANVGDSRAVMSGDGGSKIFPLSRDHKPSEENEQKRITEAGGKIYQTQAPALRQTPDGNNSKPQMQFLLGPHRVFPGRLSVSRTFGDIEAKLSKYGGNPNVVIPVPEIKAFKIAPEHDYIILASDGIYDKLSSRDVIKSVWESTQEHASNIHHQCGLGVENILREAINRRTLDNVTVVMICFKNFKYKLFPRDKTKKVTDENIVRKEMEQTRNIPSVSKSTHSTNFSSLTSAAARSNSSHNSKEKLVDQENHYEHNFMKAHHSRKNAAPLLESNIDHNVEPKRYPTEKEKGELPLSDTGSLNKKPVAKRGGGSVALTNDTQTQKVEPSHRYMHSSNSGTLRSVDYKNGEMFRFRNYSEHK